MERKKYILDKEVAAKKMHRMAYEILENNIDEERIILAGIPTNGIVIAKSIQKSLSGISAIKTDIITISLDKRNPKEIQLSKKMDFNNQVVIIVDDVVSSGKTLLYAIKPFLEFQPKKIQILVLVERSYKNFPVRPDYVGLSISTTLQEQIFVEVEGDDVSGAYMM
ncbi:MAG TPA: phosphoribosyltransferase family protein [Chitinophagaceae bacterium]|nr:phosphoribosyltransferase family protein [Chitinophagaceae bacterium]